MLRTFALALAFNAAAAEGVMAQRVRQDPRPARFAEIAIEQSTGKVLFEHNADRVLHPASTTKLMTAYLVFQALENGTLKLDQELTVSNAAAMQGETNLELAPNLTKTVTGANGRKHVVKLDARKQIVFKIKVEDALRGMLCHSANDAAYILAEAVGGTEPGFIDKMNAEAKRLGMTRTHYVNPNGMPDLAQVTTVEDMAKLSRALIEDFPKFYKYFSIHEVAFNGRTFKNTNIKMLNAYPDIDGMKTGWIAMSGFNLVASAKHGDERIIGVIYGENTPDQRTADMRRLIDFGFQKAKNPKAQFAYGTDTGPMTGKVKVERLLEIPPKEQPPAPVPVPAPSAVVLASAPTLTPANDSTAVPSLTLPATPALPARDTAAVPAPKPPAR